MSIRYLRDVLKGKNIVNNLRAVTTFQTVVQLPSHALNKYCWIIIEANESLDIVSFAQVLLVVLFACARKVSLYNCVFQ